MIGRPDLDAVLRSWLAEGAEVAPEQPIQAALDAVGRIGQRRRVAGTLVDALRPASARRLAMIAAIGILTLSIGIRVALEVGRDAEPAPSTPEPTGAVPEAFEQFAPTALGFSMTLDTERWVVDDSSGLGLEATRGDLDIFVTSGDDGRLRPCANAAGTWEQCEPVPVADLASLEAALLPDAAPAGTAVRSYGTELAGEPAIGVRIEPTGADSAVRYVTYIGAIHAGRAFLVRFEAETERAMEDAIGLARSFGYSDPGYEQSGTYRDPAAGYEITLPQAWLNATRDVDPGDDRDDIVVRFGLADSGRSYGALTVMIGQSDGTIAVCHATCTVSTAHSLDSLGEQLSRIGSAHAACIDSGLCPDADHQQSDVLLDGTPARMLTPNVRNNCLGCPDMFLHVYAIRDGRPIVLAFDYWTLRFDRLGSGKTPQSIATEIAESFRFVEAASAEPSVAP